VFDGCSGTDRTIVSFAKMKGIMFLVSPFLLELSLQVLTDNILCSCFLLAQGITHNLLFIRLLDCP